MSLGRGGSRRSAGVLKLRKKLITNGSMQRDMVDDLTSLLKSESPKRIVAKHAVEMEILKGATKRNS